jgi:hypothetical protein
MRAQTNDGLPDCGYALVTYWIPLQHRPSGADVLEPRMPEMPEMSAHCVPPPMYEADGRVLGGPASLRSGLVSVQ